MDEESVSRLKYTIVIGNGFDLDLQFKTRYSDFVESQEWADMYKRRSKQIKHYSLLQYLNGKRYIDEWFDIEAALLEYVSMKRNGSFVNNADEDKEDYRLICQALEDYLTNHLKHSIHSLESTCAGRLLKAICRESDWTYKRFYSFNFTPIDLYDRMLDNLHESRPNYLHGEIVNHSVILGIEVPNIKDMAPGYSFLIKSNNPSYRSSEISADLLKSQEVIIFGHSMNDIDMGYFEEYFKMMESNTDRNKRITFVTYNDLSKQQIFDNLRRNGVSVQLLFTHCAVDSIRTNNIYNFENSNDSFVFDELVKRL